MTAGRRMAREVVAVAEDVAVEGSVPAVASAAELVVDSAEDSGEASAVASVADVAVVRAAAAKETEARELLEEATEAVEKEGRAAEVSGEEREGDVERDVAGEATEAVSRVRAVPRSSSRSSCSPPHLYQKFDHLSLRLGRLFDCFSACGFAVTIHLICVDVITEPLPGDPSDRHEYV